MKRFFLAAAAVGILAGGVAAKDISVGVVLPLSGPLAAYGQDVISGVNLANKLAPKLANGDTVKIIALDNKGDKIETTNATTRLVSQNKVIALIGAATTPNTMQAISVAEKAKVPIIAPVASADKLLDGKKYASRVCFQDSFQGAKFADYATGNLKLKNALLIVDQSNVYSLGLAYAFEQELAKQGGKVIKKLSVNSGDKDFRAIVSQFKSLNPDLVYMPLYHPEAALIARQARQLGYTKLLAAGDGVNNQTFIDLGSDAVNGVVFTDSFDSNNPPTQLGKDFVAAYKKANGGKDLPAFAAMGADAYYVLLNAMNECGATLTSECVNEKIHSTQNFEAVGGVVSIDKSGNASRSVVIKEIKDKKQSYLTVINP